MSAGSGIDADGRWLPAFTGQREPFRKGNEHGAQAGNTLSVRSGFWVDPTLREDDRAELEQIVASVRDLIGGIDRPEFDLAVEQISLRIWRQRRAYRDLSENGVVRRGKPAPVLAELSKLENRLMADLDAFGLTPRSAVALGLDLLRGEQKQLTITRLAALAAEEDAA